MRRVLQSLRQLPCVCVPAGYPAPRHRPFEGRRELGFDIVLERITVHGSLDHPGRGQAVTAQPGNKGHGFPMAMGNAGDHPAASSTAPPEARHFRIDPGFIDEHDSAYLGWVRHKPSLTFAPQHPGRLHISAFLFAGVGGFF